MGMRLFPDGEHTGYAAEGAYRHARHQQDATDTAVARRATQLAALRETGRGWEPFAGTVAPVLALHRRVQTKTGSLTSAFASNDGVHAYEGAVLAMRQQVLREALASDLLLPARFEFASPATITSVFHAMHRRGFFREAMTAKTLRPGTVVHVEGIPMEAVAVTLRTSKGNWKVAQRLHGVPLTEAQARTLTAWTRDLGSEALAASLFTTAHAHDGTAWVPLEYFRAAERRILES